MSNREEKNDLRRMGLDIADRVWAQNVHIGDLVERIEKLEAKEETQQSLIRVVLELEERVRTLEAEEGGSPGQDASEPPQDPLEDRYAIVGSGGHFVTLDRENVQGPVVDYDAELTEENTFPTADAALHHLMSYAQAYAFFWDLTAPVSPKYGWGFGIRKVSEID